MSRVYAFIAASRFGLGPKPGDIDTISKNPGAWLHHQIEKGLNNQLPKNLPHSSQIVQSMAAMRNNQSDDAKKLLRKEGRNIYKNEVLGRLHHGYETTTPFLERLALFWSNHFTVSFKGKGILTSLCGTFDREAIRPHILGKFEDMLLASSKHPAMLHYLDNAQSIGPNSRAGRRSKKGLNENLAREILELHTLGVNGGYTQNDVIALAKIITGWSVSGPRSKTKGFNFAQNRHEPGRKTLLGKTYAENGVKEGEAALRNLARHPSTAKFIATKLARHFVSDTPDKASIKKLADTYMKTGGDLKALYHTLIRLDEAWTHPFKKTKTPYELVLSASRLTHNQNEQVLLGGLTTMDHMPFTAGSPAGWDDTQEAWFSPDSMIKRLEWCHACAQTTKKEYNPDDLARKIIGSVAHENTLKWIARAPSPMEGLALLLASPEFQRR